MRYLKAILFFAMAITFTIGNTQDAWAQKKKKEKVRTTADFENTYWRLYEMNGEQVVTPADSKEVYIKLNSKKNKLEGYTGCNIITGTYELGKESLSFEAATTERYCTDMMDTEEYILRALNYADRHVINGLYLMLYDGTYLLAIFEAKFYED